MFGIVLNALRDCPMTAKEICVVLFNNSYPYNRMQEIQGILDNAQKNGYVICYDSKYEITQKWTNREH